MDFGVSFTLNFDLLFMLAPTLYMLLFRFALRAELLLMPHISDRERHSIRQPVPHVDTRSYKHILTHISAGLVAKFLDHQKNALI